jgi:lipopolysaccharide transport system permease protein
MDQHLKITKYSSKASNRSILRHIKAIIEDLPQSHELGLRLAKRNIKALYRQSLLGVTWALVPPIVTAALWIFLRGNNVMSMGDTGLPYPLFVLIGTMLWQIFTESVNAPLKAVTTNRSMLIKINIPREALLLSGIYEVLFNVAIKIILLLAVVVYYDVTFTISLLYALGGMMVIILCGFSIGLLLTPVGMLYQDIQRGLIIVLPFLMYLTPVIYATPSSGIVSKLMMFNPMASILGETRNWLTSNPATDLNLFFLFASLFLVLSLLGTILFRIAMPIIIERIGS